MSQAPPLTIAAIRRHVADFARSNLAALLTGQAFLALVNMIILFMINRVYARPGDTADAGRLAAVLSIMLAAVVLTTSGVARTVTLRISRARAAGGSAQSDTIARTIGGGLVWGAVIGAVLALAGLALPGAVLALTRSYWPERAEFVEAHVEALQTAALWLPSCSMFMVMTAVFDGFQRMRWSLLAEEGTFQALRLAAAVLVMGVLGWAWTGLVGAWAAAYALAAGIVAIELWIFLDLQRQPVRLRGLGLAGMMHDATYMFMPAVAPMIFSQVGVVVAWAVGGNEASATFWVGWSLSLAVSAFCGSVGRVLFPAVANLRRSADQREMTRVLRRALWGVSVVAFVFLLAVQAAKPWLLSYLRQPDAGAILTALLAAGFFEAARRVFNPVLLASGMEKSLTVLEWLNLAIILIGGAAAMAAWGVGGLTAVFLAVYIVSAVVRVVMLARATGVRLWLDAAVSSAVVLALTAVILIFEMNARP